MAPLYFLFYLHLWFFIFLIGSQKTTSVDATCDKDVVRRVVSTRVREQIHNRHLQIHTVTNPAHGRLVGHNVCQPRVLVAQINGHVCQHVAWRDGVDTDANGRQLDTQRFGQGHDSTLAGTVVTRCLALAGDVGGNGRNEDNRSAAGVELRGFLFGHLGSGELGGIISAEDIDVHGAGNRLGAALQERLVRADAGGGDAAVLSVTIICLRLGTGCTLQSIDAAKVHHDISKRLLKDWEVGDIALV